MDKEHSTKGFPKVKTLNNALKLAEAWVGSMSGATTNEKSEWEVEGRPIRLGLGARAAPKMKTTLSTDPVERKLFRTLKIQKKLAQENIENTVVNGDASNEDSEDEPESRTSAFNKKRPLSSSQNVQSVKKSK